MTGHRETLAEQIERAKAAAGGRGFAVTFSGPAAEANVRGCVDGYDSRPNRAASYRTPTEQESYQYGYQSYYRPGRDRLGCRYEEALF